MSIRIIRSLLLMAIAIFYSHISVCQGIKGQDARRHTIRLSKSRSSGQPVDPLKRTADSMKRVVFIGRGLQEKGDPELTAAMEFCGNLTGYSASFNTFSGLKKDRKALENASLVWFHRTDTSCFSEDELDPEVIQLLTTYLQAGGSMVLTLDGFRYLNPLGLESVLPAVRSKPCIDHGYGRNLGFHAYRDHAVFTGLNGGSYILKPVTDQTVRIIGFFGDTVPESGKVIGIDWDYIFFREQSKMLLEYQTGAGKAIAVGGYTLFSAPNLHRLHLERFTANILDYLTGGLQDVRNYYWDYSFPSVISCGQDTSPGTHSVGGGAPLFWSIPDHPLSFPRHQATDAYCETAGERILIMATEKGGLEEIWVHPFMAMRDVTAGIRCVHQPDNANETDSPGDAGDTITWLTSMVPEIWIRPDGFTRSYSFSGGVLREMVVADPVLPSCVMHYEWEGHTPIDLIIRFSSNLRFMWPYSAEAITTICHHWDSIHQAFTIQDKSGDLVVMAGSNRNPAGKRIGPGKGFQVDVELSYPLKSLEALDFLVAAGNQGKDSTMSVYREVLNNPQGICLRAIGHQKTIENQFVRITTPDSLFNKGFAWSLIGTDRFFVHTPGMGSALVAGYATTKKGWDGGQKVSGRPGYAWYFGRDGQWSGFALLDYGDFEKVKQNLEFFIRFQDLNGKIFHEATTSGVIHYDASDATPLFIVLAGKYFRHSGDTVFLRNHWGSIRKAIDFCFSTDTDGDHLIENTNVGHGWVEGGKLYGSHSSFYLTGCWAAALREAAQMASYMKDPEAGNYQSEFRLVHSLIETLFWDPESNFYAYGLDKDGGKRTDPTILPSVPSAFSLTDPAKMPFLLKQYASNAFSTNWGVRIIREDSPLFKPTGYHYGSVWPLFTGWTALAEYLYGNHIQGFTHIYNNLNVFQEWGLGYVEEVLNGQQYEPSGVCAHQCWSETMVIQPVVEGMLGLQINLPENKLVLAPGLPVHWESLEVERIRMGNAFIHLSFQRDRDTLHWRVSSTDSSGVWITFSPFLPPGTQILEVLINGREGSFSTQTTSRSVQLIVSHFLTDTLNLKIRVYGGVSVIPVLQTSQPGEKAEGLRIIDVFLKGDHYHVEAEGLAGTLYPLRIWSALPLRPEPSQCSVTKAGGYLNIYNVDFEFSEEKYVRKQIRFTLNNQMHENP